MLFIRPPISLLFFLEEVSQNIFVVLVLVFVLVLLFLLVLTLVRAWSCTCVFWCVQAMTP